MQFVFLPGSKIVEAVVTEANPIDIGATFTEISENSATLSRFLFNNGDAITLRFLVVGLPQHNYPEGVFDLRGRIAGMNTEKNKFIITDALESTQPTVRQAPTTSWTGIKALLIMIIVFMLIALIVWAIIHMLRS